MIRFISNAAAFKAQIERVRRQQAAATVSALNATAFDIAKKDLPRNMARVFRAPVPFTLGAFMYHRAHAVGGGVFKAQVDYKYGGKGFRYGKRHYLQVQATGGVRPPKGVERKIAAGSGSQIFPKTLYPTASVPRDAYGNVSRGFWNRVLSDLKAQTEQGYAANRTAASLKRNKRYRKERYFYGGIGRASHLALGVWMRQGRKIVPVLMDAEDVRYTRRLPFEEINQRAVRARFPVYLARTRARQFGLRAAA